MGATQIQTIPSYWEYASNSPKARPALPRSNDLIAGRPVRAFDVSEDPGCLGPRRCCIVYAL